MGTTHRTRRSRRTGRSGLGGRSARTTGAAATIAVVAALVVGACSSGDGDGDDSADVTEAGDEALEAPAATMVAAGSGEGDAEGGAALGAIGAPGDLADAVQLPGQSIAVEASATLGVEDVADAVDRITATVTTRGGRVAAADVDYVTPDDDEPDPVGSRATLVLEVPPAELGAVADALEQLGTLRSFDQRAEDVTDQLADLDTRITNLRASIERVRALYAQAVDIDSIVRLEAELTQRETALEQLLATEQALEDRVAMSTLTVEVVTIDELPPTDDDRPGLLDALGAGWSAFVGGLFAIVLVLAAAMPFVLTAIAIALAVLWARSLAAARRRPVDGPTVTEPDAERTAVTASRPE